VSPCHALLHGSCSKAPLASLLKSHLGPLSASLLQRQNSPLVLLCNRCSASTSRLGVPTAPTTTTTTKEETSSSKVSTQHTHRGTDSDSDSALALTPRLITIPCARSFLGTAYCGLHLTHSLPHSLTHSLTHSVIHFIPSQQTEQ
jgi:hypothetical protein